MSRRSKITRLVKDVGRAETARRTGVSERTVKRWEREGPSKRGQKALESALERRQRAIEAAEVARAIREQLAAERLLRLRRPPPEPVRKPPSPRRPKPPPEPKKPARPRRPKTPPEAVKPPADVIADELAYLRKQLEQMRQEAIERRRDSIDKAERMGADIRDKRFGPEDLAPSGEQWFEYLARVTGLTAREAYSTLVGSPPALGIAA